MSMPIDVTPVPASSFESLSMSADFEPDIELGGPDPYQLINERRLEAENAEALRLARAL